MTRLLTTLCLAAAAASTHAFAPTSLPLRTAISQPLMAVVDVNSEAEFDAKVSGAGDKLVVIDYSTTWCGPCKVIAPKFDELSDQYPDSVFIKVSCYIWG
jgi:thioredoxin 1